MLVSQVIKYLDMAADKVYVDCTLGEGGHSYFFLKNFNLKLLIGIEQDPILIEIGKERLKEFNNFKAIRGNFKDLDLLLENSGIKEVDGIFFDLGVSMFHFKSSGRGFSFQRDEELDMRLNCEGIKASDVVNNFSFEELFKIIKDYGEERFARKIAKAIIEYREREKIERTFQLVEIVKKAIGFRKGKRRIHPATRTFQALRIYVNNELNNLRVGIEKAIKILKKNGRIVILSYHSLEDRIVKERFKLYERDGILKILTKKPVKADKDEILENISSRSAKLRAAEKII